MKKISSAGLRAVLLDWGVSTLGVLLLSIGITSFSASNNIAPGGVSGLAIIFNYLTGFPIGAFSLLLNVPLFALALKLQSKAYVFKTAVMVVLCSVFMDLLLPLFPVYTGNVLLASFFGGGFMGAGLGLVFWRGFSTGGTDIIAQLINKFNPHLQVGSVMGVIDALIIAASALVYRNIEAAMYALISVFISSMVIDRIVYGFDKGRMVMVISRQYQQIVDGVIKELDRSATIIKAVGAYTGGEQYIVLCAVYRNQFYALKKLVYAIDSSAFVIACESNEVLGDGFKPLMEK